MLGLNGILSTSQVAFAAEPDLLGKGAGCFPSLSLGKQRQKIFKNIALGSAAVHHSLFRNLL